MGFFVLGLTLLCILQQYVIDSDCLGLFETTNNQIGIVMTPDRKFFRDRLLEMGMSQRQLGRIMGIDHASLNRIFSGERGCSLREATDLARHLQLPLPMVSKKLGVKMGDLNLSLTNGETK